MHLDIASSIPLRFEVKEAIYKFCYKINHLCIIHTIYRLNEDEVSQEIVKIEREMSELKREFKNNQSKSQVRSMTIFPS